MGGTARPVWQLDIKIQAVARAGWAQKRLVPGQWVLVAWAVPTQLMGLHALSCHCGPLGGARKARQLHVECYVVTIPPLLDF